MGVNEEFKQAIKAGKLAEALKLAMAGGVQLKITTTVVSADASKQSLSTGINLVEGAINNVVSEQFMEEGVYETIKQFHFAQVADVNQTIGNNLDSLSKMFRIMASLQQSSQQKVVEDGVTVEAQVISPQAVLVTPEVVEDYVNVTEIPSSRSAVGSDFSGRSPQTIKPEVETFMSYTSSQKDTEAIIPEIVTPTVEVDDFDLGDDKQSEDDDEWGDFLDDLDEDKDNKNSNHKKDNQDDF